MKSQFLCLVFFVKLIAVTNFKFSDATITIFDENNVTITNIDSLTSGFGPRISEDGFQGYIVPAKPLSGCTKIDPPPNNVSYVDPKKWIAIIQRTPSIFGNCSFDVKVHNAQLAGFSAVIIFNSESDNLIKMSSSGYYNIKIPSVFIGHASGLDIIQSYTYENKTYVILSNDDSDLNYLLIPFVSVVSVCFLIAVCIFVIKLALHCRKMRKNRFPKSALKKIPTKKYQKTDKYDTCPICLNEYEEGVKIRILPCEHVYHIECIDKWLLRNNRLCPVCKRRVIPGDPDSENEEGTGASTANNDLRQVHHQQEHEPNEDDDTNETSRLLVNRNQSNDDNSSLLTTSTNLHNLTTGSNLTSNLNNNNEISSLNNHMTTSITSSQLIQSVQLPQRGDLIASSSKYGSISSINIAEQNASTLLTSKQNEDLLIDNRTDDENLSRKNPIDSKQTPEFFSVTSDSYFSENCPNEPTTTFNLANSNVEKEMQMKTIAKGKNKKSK